MIWLACCPPFWEIHYGKGVYKYQNIYREYIYICVYIYIWYCVYIYIMYIYTFIISSRKSKCNDIFGWGRPMIMISGCKTQPLILSSIWSCQMYPDIRKPFLNHIDFNCQPPFSPLLIFLYSFVLCQPASRKPFLNTRFCLLQNTWTILLSHPFHPFLSIRCCIK